MYAYSPYGETTALGPDEGNPLQYTGRENDGTGLYYYRGRYYDSVLKRFISEDPIGLAGGLNLAAYVRGNPISFNDPTGEIAPALLILGGAALVVGSAYVGYNLVEKAESFYDFNYNFQRAQQLIPQIKQAYDACVNCNDQAACRRYVELTQEYQRLVGGATSAGGGMSNVPSGGPLPGQMGGAAGQIMGK